MPATRTHNANQVKVIFAGIEMKELGEDQFVSVKRNTGAFELTMSVDGFGVREQSNDNSAQIEVTLLATSPINALLTGIHQLDKASKNGSGIAPLSVQDLNSAQLKELHFAEQAWIRSEPEVSYGRGVAERTWVFETDKLISFHGGH